LNIRQTIIERLKQHVEEIHSFTNGLSSDQLKARPADDKWSLHELVLHLCEVQDVFIERLVRMLTEEGPQITPYEPDAMRRNGIYLTQNFTQRLVEFEKQRGTLTALLQSLTDDQWKLQGKHPQMKLYTIERSMEDLMRHEEHHLHQMYTVFFGIRSR
jgi:hypothetical protein